MRISFIMAVLLVNICAAAENATPSAIKPRVFVLADISNEPGDEESLVRFLVYANEFDVEGIVATAFHVVRKTPRVDLIQRDTTAYAPVRSNLLKQAPRFPARNSYVSVPRLVRRVA